MTAVRVLSFELHPIRIPFKAAFKHARHERTRTDAVIVELRSADGLSGFGEALPRDYVTGETIESVLGTGGPSIGARFVGQRFTRREDVALFLGRELDLAGRSLAAFAGFEIALLDLAGRSLGFALGEILGGIEYPAPPAGVVIGFEVATPALPKYCAVLRLRGKRHIKVKVGLPDDRERLTIIAEIVQAPLRLDANGAWASPRRPCARSAPWSRSPSRPSSSRSRQAISRAPGGSAKRPASRSWPTRPSVRSRTRTG